MDTQTHWHPIALEDLLHSKPLLVIFGISFSFYFSLEHRVSIEGKSHNKESYTVNSDWKMFDDISVMLAHAWNFGIQN